METLLNDFSLIACPKCGNRLLLSFELNVVCNSGEKDCQFEDTFWTSKKEAKARNLDVNRHSFYAMRRIGNGHQGLNRYSRWCIGIR